DAPVQGTHHVLERGRRGVGAAGGDGFVQGEAMAAEGDIRALDTGALAVAADSLQGHGLIVQKSPLTGQSRCHRVSSAVEVASTSLRVRTRTSTTQTAQARPHSHALDRASNPPQRSRNSNTRP